MAETEKAKKRVCNNCKNTITDDTRPFFTGEFRPRNGVDKIEICICNKCLALPYYVNDRIIQKALNIYAEKSAL